MGAGGAAGGATDGATGGAAGGTAVEGTGVAEAGATGGVEYLIGVGALYVGYVPAAGAGTQGLAAGAG